MRKLITVLFISILSNGYAQLDSYSYVDDGAMIKFEPRYITINTLLADPDSIKNPKGFTIRLFSLDHVTFDQGGYQDSHRFAFITESLSGFLIDMINGGNFETGFKNSSTSLSDFILGWHNHVVNVVSLDNFNAAIGAHWGDYFLAYEPYNAGSNTYEVVNEPAGWYGALGPAIMMDLNVLDVVNLHFEGSYAFTAKFMDATDMNFDRAYPKPHFINLSLQLRTNSPIYAGFEQIRSVNRGDNPFNATRSDIFIGVWF